MNVLLGYLEKFAFGLTKEFHGFSFFVIGVFGDAGGGGNETATHGGFVDDFGVSLGMGGRRDKASELGQISRTAGFFGEFLLFEPVADGQQVDGLMAFVERPHRGINMAVTLVIEILRLDDLGDIWQRFFGNQNSTK